MSDTVMVGCEGDEMTMHVWTPPSGGGPGLLLIQEIFGVGPYIRAVGQRLADAGYVVGAPDVFWRFAPGWEAAHDAGGLAASRGQVAQLDREQAVLDCVAALDALRGHDATTGHVGAIGFCLGGSLAFAVAIAAEPAVCVSYYGSGVHEMLDSIDEVECPTLFHFGNADAYIPNEHVEAVNVAIDGRPGFVLNVENAGHAFDNHDNETFYDESAANAAWAKTRAFLAEHLPVR
ncbi:MAG: dienelactone hydrolase family protein [Ilumatobacter sp.]|uniref:dienelactone hydrolase family protein n=1 Tax=Ilumatobacter sp. TaxID=1967498 RepID=UPI00261EA349|nr:dienelactone hydrolase family protein [Ilumatobacter sp.]MDJ0767385.1 dienelactone hydrolase family protein [Ilumatobacter sp.]